MNNQKINKGNTLKISNLGLLIALQVLLSHFLSINTPVVRIGFGFLPLAIIGMIYGPISAGVCAIISDILGWALFPTGAYFPGFTLTAFLTAFSYGTFLYKKDKSLKRILIPVLIVCILLNLILDTFWLTLLLGKGYMALLPTRVLKSIIMIPVQLFTISIIWDRLIIKFSKLIHQ